jgi:Clp amino terminal domain, pathogenicity island component/ClpX C4-type zinc finger
VFERFTDQARRVVVLAQEESRLLNHNYIGTEHLLLGLIHEGEGVAALTLESLGISLVHVRAQVEEIIGRGGTPPSGHIPFTPRAKKVLELSLREALQLGHDYIGSEHILLGLIREGEGVAAQVLVRLGAELPFVRQRVVEMLSGRGEYAPSVTPVMSESFGERRPSATIRRRDPMCAFCRRDLSELEHYATGTDAAICGECITAAHRALEAAPDKQQILVLPPRVVGTPPADDPEAADKIASAYRAVFGPAAAEQAGALEHGDHLMPRVLETLGGYPQMHIGDVRIIEVRFITPDLPEVRFNLHLDEVGTGYPCVGSAVRSGERWLVSAHTILGVLGGLGIELPPEA